MDVIRQASLLVGSYSESRLDPRILTPERALEMATSGGARATLWDSDGDDRSRQEGRYYDPRYHADAARMASGSRSDLQSCPLRTRRLRRYGAGRWEKSS